MRKFKMTDDVMAVGKVRATHNVFCGYFFLWACCMPVGRVGIRKRRSWVLDGNEVRVN